jgi:hypothetical protein
LYQIPVLSVRVDSSLDRKPHTNGRWRALTAFVGCFLNHQATTQTKENEKFNDDEPKNWEQRTEKQLEVQEV